MCALNKVKGMNVYMKKKILISYVSYSNTSKSVAYNIYDKLDKKKIYSKFNRFKRVWKQNKYV